MYERGSGEYPHDVSPGTDSTPGLLRRHQVATDAPVGRVEREHEECNDVDRHRRGQEVARLVIPRAHRHLGGAVLHNVKEEDNNGNL